MKIASLIDKRLVAAHLKARNKEAVLEEIVALIVKHKKLKESREILRSLLERETKGSTGIGLGAAIPHTRIENLNEVILFVGISKKGIDFNSLDNKPVRLIVLFLTPLAETGTHLQILSKISALVKNQQLVKQLIMTANDDELYQLLRAKEIEKGGFMSLSKDEIYLELDTSESGLSEAQARERLSEYGTNELKKVRRSDLWKRFLHNFTNTLAVMMWIGSILAFIVQMPEVGWAIMAVIVINALFSFWQEYRAEKALAALKHLMPIYVRIIRAGRENKILASEVVPGDIILVEEGDSIPADARLIEAHELRVDNSVFSGESRPGYKMAEPFRDGVNFIWNELPNLVFAGTSVVSGQGKAVVIATGMSTEIGKIAYLTQTIREELSPLQKEIVRLTKVIALLAVVMGGVFLVVGRLAAGLTFAGAAIFAIGIILGNVPEGLMPTVTLALAMGVQRMARRHALIKKLASVETLGCTNVICSDKTGTLTTSQISVRKIWLNGKRIEVSGSDYEPRGEFFLGQQKIDPADLRADRFDLFLQAGMLCSTAKLLPPDENRRYWIVSGDPTEGALLTMAAKAGYDCDSQRNACLYVQRFPFESVRKRMSCINRLEDGRLRAFIKGAPKEILDLSSQIVLGDSLEKLGEDKKNEIISQIDALASEGLRVLALAYRDVEPEQSKSASAETIEKNLVFIGLAAMYDPPRPEVRAAIARCQKAGIRVVMITGDYGITAMTIARQVGIVSSADAQIITSAELNNLTDEELKKRLAKEVVFARVNPEHKLRIVNAFKELGNIVAVTGDGVNDAPALKRADIGVAMGIRGTDVAKEAADMVLTDDNFASIVSAIEEGRAVFDNIKKFITYIFAHLIPEAVPFIFYVIFRLPAPITAMQILAIDLGTETLPALALGVEKPEAGIMEKPPRPRKKGLVDRIVLFRGYVFLGLLDFGRRSGRLFRGAPERRLEMGPVAGAQ